MKFLYTYIIYHNELHYHQQFYINIYIYCSVPIYIQGVSKPMSQTFPGYSPPQNKQKFFINMGPKTNRFRDIDLRSCAGTLLSIT